MITINRTQLTTEMFIYILRTFRGYGYSDKSYRGWNEILSVLLEHGIIESFDANIYSFKYFSMTNEQYTKMLMSV